MDPKLTGRRYDEIAEQWLAPHLQTNGIAQLERAIQFVTARGHALDIGCGCSGRFVSLLKKRGFHPEGIDISARMITLARQRHPEIIFHEGDICEWTFAQKYDFISAWDSTWHLPLEKQMLLLERICAALNPGGVYLFTTGGVDQPDVRTNSHMGPEFYYAAPATSTWLESLSKLGCACRHLEYDQNPEPHLYIIAHKL